MTKKSNRQAVQYENQSGCMWGFINILDFRSRSTRKLLSDRKHWRFSQGNTSIKFGVLRNYNEDSQSTLGGEEKKSVTTAGAGKPSVKKLMEEDMFGEPDTNKDIRNVEIKVVDGSQMTKRQKRKKNKSEKKSGDAQCHDINASGDLESQQSCHRDSEQQSVSNINIDVIIREFCSQIHHEILSCEEHDLDEMKSNSKHYCSEEKLCEAVKLFLNQKCLSEKQFEEIGKFLNPKALKDALEILRTDKDLFLKCLQDSNSEWWKSNQNLKDVGEEENENSKSNQEIVNPIKPELILHKKHNFFRRMVKSPDRHSLNRREDSQTSNRIVILKPGTAGMQNTETTLAGSNHVIKNKDPSVKSVSHFSFSELKRRLKHAMGKEHHEISSDIILEENSSDYRNPVSGKGVLGENVGIHSPTKDHFFMERMVKPSMSTRMRDKARKSKEFEITTANDSERVSNIYIEAKKHLSDMLSNGDENESTSNRLARKSLGRILSLSEYNTPSASPGREQESNFISTQTRLSTSDNLETSNESTSALEAENILVHSAPATQNREDQKCSSGGNSWDSSLTLDWVPNISDGVVHEDEKEITIPAINETSSGGDLEIIKITDDVAMDAPSEPVSAFITEQIGETPETFDGKEYSEDLQEDVYEEKQPQSSPLASPLKFSIADKVEDQKNDTDIQDRPSPISVLEPLYIEDEIGSASKDCPPVELPIQSLQIKFEEDESCDTDEGIHMKPCRDEKESILEYVKAVLQGSGLDWDELYMRSLSSDQLLNPALLNEIEFFSNQLCHDKQLLFDCINEVVMEAYGQHFSCSQWVSFVKPSISPAPDMKIAIQGVWEGICWHLLSQPLPRTLEQIVGRDMAKSGAWMDLRFDVESIGIDIWEVIFEELMEDTVFGCIPYPAVQNEPVKDN